LTAVEFKNIRILVSFAHTMKTDRKSTQKEKSYRVIFIFDLF